LLRYSTVTKPKLPSRKIVRTTFASSSSSETKLFHSSTDPIG